MPTPRPFKEPVSSDYVYIDEDNRVHVMMPIVGGDEIGIDNTCKTAMELKRFFFGSTEKNDSSRSHTQKSYPSVIEILQEYVDALQHDIEMLESLDFGDFFDKDDVGKALAGIVKQGLIAGKSIETLIIGYINRNRRSLGLRAPLTAEQQAQITDAFNRHYRTIQRAPHFDEFLIANPDLPGSVYTHRGKMCVHFYEFLLHQRPDMNQSLKQSISSMLAQFQPRSNRLVNKNRIIIREDPRISETVKKITTAPLFLLKGLTSDSETHGIPLYQLLNKEQRATICFDDHWPMLEEQIRQSTELPLEQQQEILKLFSRSRFDSDRRCKDFWSERASKPLLKSELRVISADLLDTVKRYDQNRNWFFIKNKSRAGQCKQLQELGEVIRLIAEGSPQETEILDQILKATHVLDEIDNAITQEKNKYQSQLQLEIRETKQKLMELCGLTSMDSLPGDAATTCQNHQRNQLNKISNPDIRVLVESLPAHCQTEHAVTFWNTLSLAEAHRLADYLRMTYHPFNKPVDGVALSQAVDEAFRLRNQTSELLNGLNTSLNALLESSDSTSGNSIINRLLHGSPTTFWFNGQQNEEFKTYQEKIQLIQTTLNAIASSCANQENELPDDERERIMTALSEFQQRFTESIVSPMQSAGGSHLQEALANANQCVETIDHILEQMTPAARYTQSTSP